MKNLISTRLALLFIIILIISAPVQAQWVRVNGPGGARINCFTASGDHIYAGSEAGIHISSDNGSSWRTADNGLPDNTPFMSLASKGSSSFAGTYGKGIYSSTDEGASWAEANNGLPDLTNGQVTGFAFIGDTVFAGVNTTSKSQVYISKDNGKNWTSMSNGLPELNFINALGTAKNRLFAATFQGLYRSTDNGRNWKLLDSGITSELMKSLAVEGDTVYAGTDNGGIWGSFDGGTSWKQYPAGFGGVPIRAIAVNGRYVYAGIYEGNYRSSDNGNTWNPSTSGLTDKIINALFVKDNLVFAGTYNGGVFISSDNGLSWNWANKGMNYSIAAAMLLKDNILFSGTSARVYSSGDNGDSWNARYYGLDSSEIISFTLSGNDILAVSKNRIYRSSDNGMNWASITENLPETKFNAAAASGKYIFAGSDSGVFRSTDKGSSWKAVNNGIKTYVDGILEVTHLTAVGNNIIAGAKISPGGGGIFLTTDYGENWTAVIMGEGMPFGVNAITVAGDKIFIAYNFGYSHRQFTNVLTDGGKTSIGAPRGLPPNTDISNFYVLGSSCYVQLTWGQIYLASWADTIWVEANDVFPEKLISLVYNDKYAFAGTEGLGIFRRPVSELITFPPAAPKLLSVSDNSIDQPLSLTLSWNESSGAEKNNLLLSKDGLFKEIIINDSAAVSPKEIKGLKEGIKYYWKVCSRNSAGEGPYSEAWKFTTILYAPEGLEASVQDNKKVILTWKDKSGNETGYIIERKQSEDFVSIDTVKANVTNYTDSTTKQPTTYQYRIKAYTPFAVSAYSNIASITITGLSDKKVIPPEFSLFQNYPNPFNPVTSIKYTLPSKFYVELKISDILGREVFVLVSKEQDTGEYNVKFDGSKLPTGIYIYTIRAGSFRASRKLLLLK